MYSLVSSLKSQGVPLDGTTQYNTIAAALDGPATPPPTTRAPTTPPASGTCHVSYQITSQWNVGFTANVVVSDTGSSPVNGWTLRGTFANGQAVTQGWNGTFTQSGARSPSPA